VSTITVNVTPLNHLTLEIYGFYIYLLRYS